MEMVLAAFCMVMCKKLPAEISCPPNLHTKIRLVAPKAAEKPCAAFVRLTFPMKKNEAPVRESAESAGLSQPEFVEIEQDDKSLAVNGNNAALDYSVTVINCAASRQAREDFLEAIKKTVPETFLADQGQSQKAIMALAEELNNGHEDAYIVAHTNEYEVPLFEIPVNAHTFDW
jgi:hypothetical protein